MSIFAKINNLSTSECLLEQKVEQIINNDSFIKSYCIKDMIVLEADGTGIIDYCPFKPECNFDNCNKKIKNILDEETIKTLKKIFNKNLNDFEYHITECKEVVNE
jgi:hypothetical protein